MMVLVQASATPFRSLIARPGKSFWRSAQTISMIITLATSRVSAQRAWQSTPPTKTPLRAIRSNPNEPKPPPRTRQNPKVPHQPPAAPRPVDHHGRLLGAGLATGDDQ